MTQPATASGTSPVGVEPLVSGVFRALVPAPGFFALAHFDYRPGAFFPPAEGAGPVVFRMLEGTLEFDAEDVVTKTPAGTTTPQDMRPGQKFTVTAGDQLVVPGDVEHSARAVGGTAARFLGLALFGAAPPQEFPQGIRFEPLTLGQVQPLPSAPAAAAVQRLTLPEGARYELASADGPRIVHVESGRAGVTLSAGSGQYWQGKQPFDPPAALRAGEPVQLSPSDGVLLQANATATITGGDPDTDAAVLAAAVTGAGDATPGRPDTGGAVNKQLVRRYVSEVIDGANPALAGQYCAANYFNHDRPPGQDLGLAAVTAYLRSISGAFSGISTAIEEEIGEDDIVLERWRRTATNSGSYQGLPASGRQVELSGTTISRVRDGRIVEEWEEQDVAALLEQLGSPVLTAGLDEEGATGAAAAKLAAGRFIYDVWNGGDLSLVDELYADDFVNHSLLPGQRAGRDGVKQFVSRWRTAFPDVNVTIDLLVAEGDRAGVRWTSRGTQQAGMLGVAPSGRYITVSGITVLLLRDGKIAESSQQWGVTDFLEQAGARSGGSADTEGR
jgi:steroid delta-isomerase-like uncharacterized protein